jgi:hypothetical protein
MTVPAVAPERKKARKMQVIPDAQAEKPYL